MPFDTGSGLTIDKATGRALFATAVSNPVEHAGHLLDPVTGSVLGEFGSTIEAPFFPEGLPLGNIFDSSDDLSTAAWARNDGVTAAACPDKAPDNTKTAWRITSPALRASPQLFQTSPSAAPAAGTPITVHLWVKAGIAGSTISELRPIYSWSVLNDVPRTVNSSCQIISGPGTVTNASMGAISGLSTTEWTEILYTATVDGAVNRPLQMNFPSNKATDQAIDVWGPTAAYSTEPPAITIGPDPLPAGTLPVQVLGTAYVSGIAMPGSAMACFNLGSDPLPATAKFVNGFPVTEVGELIVNGFDPVTSYLNGIPFCANGAVAVNEGFTPMTNPPVSVDPFFTTPWNTVWLPRFGAINVEIVYQEADLWVKGGGWGIQQGLPWLKDGQYVTFFVRLTESRAQNTSIQLRAEPRASSTVIGSFSIPAGSVLGTARILMSNLTDPGNEKLVFLVDNINAANGSIYYNDFSGSGGNTTAGWEYTTGYDPSGTLAPVTTAVLQTLGGRLATGTGGSNGVFYAPSSFTAGDVEVNAVIDETGGNTGVMCRMTDTAMVGVIFTSPNSALAAYEWNPTLAGIGNFQGTQPAYPFTARLVLKGTDLTLYINGENRGTIQTSVVASGRVGFRIASSALSLGLVDSLQAFTGGIRIESQAACITEADGGLPQTQDPYLNSGGAPWGGAVLPANNALVFLPGGTPYTQQNFTVNPGETVEVRCYVAKASPESSLRVELQGAAPPDGTLAQYLVPGWNAVSLKNTDTVAKPTIYIAERGSNRSSSTVVHFFIATKVAAAAQWKSPP